jgi:DNA-binding NtrC family response regulator
MDELTPTLESIYVEDHDGASMELLRSAEAAPISGVRSLPEEGIDLRAAVEEFESDLIRQALAKTGGNKNKAAQLLRLNRTTLVEMVKRKRLNVA